MGLLDLPPISEMDDLEQAAARGDNEAFEMVLRTLSPEKRLSIRRQQSKYGASNREVLIRVGVIAETRGRKPNINNF